MKGNGNDRRAFIAGLRAVADFYERNPEAYYDGMTVAMHMYIWGNRAASVLDGMRELFGECATIEDDRHVTVEAAFSERVKVGVFAPRSKLTGTIPKPGKERTGMTIF